MSVKVLPLKGYNAMAAMPTYHRLLLGLKMLPDYASIDYVAFYEMFGVMQEHEKESLLRQAIAFVKLEREELEPIIALSVDKNGVPLSSINIKNMDLEEIYEVVVAVGMAYSRLKIRLVTEEEKKN